MKIESASGKGAEDKRGIEAVLMGMPDKDIQMGEPEITETIKTKIRHANAQFNIAAGPRVGEPGQYEGQYVLGITYADSEVAHKKDAPLHGWAQGIGEEYGREANKLARDFCERHGFTVA